MTKTTTRKISGAMALTLIGAALAASPALAERPDDRGGMLGVGAAGAGAATPTAVPDVFERAVARSVTVPARPDDRGDARGPGAYFSAPPLPGSAVSADGFAWDDASVGAGAVLAALLLAGGVAVSARHRGRVTTT